VNCCLCVAVPDAPRSVEVLSSLPTEILVSVQPPSEDGGMPVTGYRVEFEDQAQDFSLGKLLTLLSVTAIRLLQMTLTDDVHVVSVCSLCAVLSVVSLFPVYRFASVIRDFSVCTKTLLTVILFLACADTVSIVPSSSSSLLLI